MSEGDEVGGPARPVAHDDGHWRIVGDVFEHRADGVRAALDHETHHRRAAMSICGTKVHSSKLLCKDKLKLHTPK